MSGKTSPTSVSSIPTCSFYGESPPKRSRLHENNAIRPAFKSLKDNLIKFERKLSEPIKSIELKETSEHETGEEPREKSLDRDSPIPLKNLGNTCYENSIIQCLFNLNMFMDNFESSMSRMRQLVVQPKIISLDADASSPLEDNNNSLEEFKSDQSPPVKIDNVETNDLNETPISEPTITDTDVRYRIADAFDKLYKSYTKKRIQLEQYNQNNTSTTVSETLLSATTTSSTITTVPTATTTTSLSNTIDAIDTIQLDNKDHLEGSFNFRSNTAIPLCKSIQTGQFNTLTSCSNDNTEISTTVSSDAIHTTSEATSSRLTPIALVSPTATSNEQSEIEVRLEDLKSAVGERSAQFNSTHQQDASEFFYHVIDSIQEFYQGLDKTQDEDNPVTKAFELELDYSIKCPKCHHKIMSQPEKIRTLPLALPNVNSSSNETSDNQENEANGAPTPPTSDLGLDSPKSNSSSEEHRYASDEKENQSSEDRVATNEENISNNTISKLELSDKESCKNSLPQQQKKFTLCDALNNYFKDDLLDYNCSQKDCDSKQRTKKCYIRKLPQVLFITLARYSYTGKKNLDEVEAPFELSVPLRENRSPSQSPSAHRYNEDEDNEYVLVAVVCHLGSSLNAGHYTSYVYNQNNFSWYSCDDDSITKVQEADVKNDATKSGYCFFYAHKSCINKKEPPQQEQRTEQFQPVVELDQEKLSRTIDISSGVADSSVVMTPESSPKSSPSPSEINAESKMHVHTTCCLNKAEEIDDWI